MADGDLLAQFDAQHGIKTTPASAASSAPADDLLAQFDAQQASMPQAAPAGPSLGDTLGNIADSIGYGITNLPNLGADLIEKFAPLDHRPDTASYGSGAGALVDNPLTRGLAQSADTGAAGLNELLGRIFVAPVDYFRPGTLAAYRNTMVTPAVQAAQAQEAPADATLAARALQGLSSLAGQVSIAGASGGGTADARAATQAASETPTLAAIVENALKSPQARLAGTLGSEAGGAQVAAQEASGKPVSNAKAASIVAANTAANLIPMGEGLPLVVRIPAGIGAGIGGNALVNAANGQPLLEGALPAGTLGALLGGIAAHGEAPRAEPARAPESAPALDDIAARMRAELKAKGLSDAQIEAILNPAPEPQTAALPAPVVHVDSAGNAATQAQAEAAQRAAQSRAAELGLSPDVIAAQAMRNARAPAEAAPAAPRALPPPVVHVDASGNASTSADFMQQLRAAADALQRQRALGLTPDVQRAQAMRMERATAGLPVRDLSGMDAALAEEGRRPAEQGAPEPEPGAPAPTPEKVAAYFSNLPKEIGWEQRGGRLLRAAGAAGESDGHLTGSGQGDVIGRTTWIPKIGGDGQPSQFWRMRPDKALTEAQAHEAFRKVAAGEPLRPIEQRFVDYAQKTAHEYAQAEAEDTARFEAEQNEADDIERQRAIEDLRNENARLANADHGEAFTLAQWIRRAHDAGVPRELVGAAMNHDDWTQRLTALIREQEHGTDQGTTVVGDERGVSPDRQGQAATVREGEGAPGQEGAGQPEPGSAEASAGQVRFSRPGTPPSGDLFGTPTSADRLRAAQEAKDAQRNGKTGGREPTGDGGLFDGERPEQIDLGNIREQTTTYERDASQLQGSRAGERVAVAEPSVHAGRGPDAGVSGQLDLFTPASESRSATRETAARLLRRVQQVTTGSFRAGIDHVRNWKDAAHVIAPLRKRAQENMLALVTDAEGKPLAIIRHTVGMKDSAAVDAGIVAGAVVDVPGAKHVYFGHNHPTGVPTQSIADRNITNDLHNLMSGTGVEAHGMIVVAPGSREATYYLPAESEHLQYSPINDSSEIPAARRKSEVPVTERVLRRIGNGEAASSPREAQAIIEKYLRDGDGVVLLDNRHRVIGVLPMTSAEMARLRTGDPKNGAAEVLRQIHRSNANAALIKAVSRESVRNIGALLADANVRPIDAFVPDATGELTSMSSAGQTINGGTYRSIGRGATHTPEQVRATLRGSPLGRAFGKLEEAGALRIESHPDQDWSGYWDGDKAVLNAARAGEEGWLGTAMHELGGHGSLHEMLGDEGFARALSDIRSLADAKGPAGDIVRRAMRRVESADTPARHRDEELLAYTISEAVREGKAWKSGALNSALVRIFNRIRAWMKTSAIGKLLAKHGVDWKLNPDDIAALAESGIRRMAREVAAPAHEPMAEPLFQRVFHGSPHRGIEKEGFKLHKIGSGEGAQAYGWGMYFAKLRDVADAYRPRNHDAEQEMLQQYNRAERGHDYESAELWEAAMLHKHPNDIRNGNEFEHPPQAKRDTVADELTAIYKRHQKGGQLYHAEIPEDSDLLDWDKPIGEQPEGVRTAMQKLAPDYFDAAREVENGARARDVSIQRGVNLFDLMNPTGAGFYEHLSQKLGGAKEASQALAAENVPGLRYLDQGSRGAGEGSHNYVIWDEAHLNKDVTPYYSRRASETNQTGTPEFARWFGASKVVDAQGKPLTVHHGTADGFYAFDNARLGEATAHMTAPLGHFFAEDAGKAQRYAENASRGVPADERVIDAHLSIQNPKTLSLDDLMGIESQDEARALKANLEAQGYDGIHLPEIGQWIAFDPGQIKSASENMGSFDRGNPDIRYSRPTPQDRAGEEGRGASGPGEPGSTGVKNEQVTRERAARGLDELQAEGKRSFGAVWDAAGEKLRTDPHAGQALAQHIIASPRPLKAEETALLSQDRARIIVNRHAAAEDVNRAVQSGDVTGEAIARAKLQLANDQMDVNDKAARASGYEQGLGLAMRKAMAQLDYSLEGMESRLQAAKGTPLDEADLQRLKDLHVEMQANEAALAGRRDAQRGKQKETKAQLDEQLRLFKDQLDQAESRKDVARQKQLRKQIAELARRIVEGDYSKTARTPIQYNEETKKLEAQRNFLRKKFDRMAAEAEHKNRSPAFRAWHTFLAFRRAVILSGVHTLGKLSSAALLRIGVSPVEHAVQHGLGWLPGIRGIAQRAPIEGRFSPKAEAHALQETFSKETLKEMALKFGNRGTNDLLYGKDRVSLHPWLDLVGQVHAALKTPSERNAFARSMAMLSEFEAKAAKERGLSPAEVADYLSQPDVNGYITARAYEESMRAIFKHDNKFVSALHAFQGMLRATKDGKSNLAGKAVAELMDYLFPVQKIPTNYIGEAFSYLGGGAKALAQLHASKILKEGLDNLTPEAADYIMRNLGKQTVGAALLALGYLGYKGLGSFYQQGDNHKKHVREADSIGPVPGWLAEHPALLMLTAGANFHRIQDGIRTQTSRAMVGTGSSGDAALNTIRSLLEKTPYIYTIENLSDRFRSKQSTARYLGNEAASAVIQPDLKRYARESDTAPRRYPRGFTDAFEMNVPGLREHVPTHPQRRP